MGKLSIGTTIYSVYGDGFVEPVTKEYGTIIKKKDDYYIAQDNNGREFTVFVDDTFNNLDFDADVGTDYRVFTNKKDADAYFKYLNEEF